MSRKRASSAAVPPAKDARPTPSPLALDFAARLGKFYLGRECYGVGLTHPLLALGYNDLRSWFSDPALGHNVLVHVLQPLLTMADGRYYPAKLDISEGRVFTLHKWADITNDIPSDMYRTNSPDITVGGRESLTVWTDGDDDDNSGKLVTHELDGRVNVGPELVLVGGRGCCVDGVLSAREPAVPVFLSYSSVWSDQCEPTDARRELAEAVFPKIDSPEAVHRHGDVLVLFPFYSTYCRKKRQPVRCTLRGELLPAFERRINFPPPTPDRIAWMSDPRTGNVVMLYEKGGKGRLRILSPEMQVLARCEFSKNRFARIHDGCARGIAAFDGAGRLVVCEGPTITVIDMQTGKVRVTEVRLPRTRMGNQVYKSTIHVDALGRIVVPAYYHRKSPQPDGVGVLIID